MWLEGFLEGGWILMDRKMDVQKDEWMGGQRSRQINPDDY